MTHGVAPGLPRSLVVGFTALAAACGHVVPAWAQHSTVTCRAAVELVHDVVMRGTTVQGGDDFHASCASEALSSDRVFSLRLRVASRVSLRLVSDYDAVLYVRARCDDPVTELACNDDGPDNRHSSLDLDLAAGTYWVFVDGYDTDSVGGFSLVATIHPRPAVMHGSYRRRPVGG